MFQGVRIFDLPREDETREHCMLCVFKFQGCNGEVLPVVRVVKVTQSCPTLCDPIDYRFHGILQARILEWVAVLFSRESSQPRIKPRILYQLSHQRSPVVIVIACNQDDAHQASPISTCFTDFSPFPSSQSC